MSETSFPPAELPTSVRSSNRVRLLHESDCIATGTSCANTCHRCWGVDHRRRSTTVTEVAACHAVTTISFAATACAAVTKSALATQIMRDCHLRESTPYDTLQIYIRNYNHHWVATGKTSLLFKVRHSGIRRLVYIQVHSHCICTAIRKPFAPAGD